ncbi:nucleotidyltransferase family protein [Niabella aurantiaca]|uniref:nucleotidyltransferase family protein n=1 Tax=Niabella aurantiaca TaxID=379900 RepID=UPI00035C8DA4|nr:nucleotidyltransferase family protein [Niabella aurantiaca]
MKPILSDPIDNLSVAQTMLVRACLAGDKATRTAYVRAWEEEVQIMDLDFSSSRLVPYLLYKNQQEGIRCLHDKRLKVIYKYWWLRTQHISNQLSRVHAAFLAGGIGVAVIKGASIKQYYERAELRPMSDFDLLVPVQQLPEAIGVLRRLDFIPEPLEATCLEEKPGLLLDFGHAISCTNRNNDTFIDLHWKIGSNCTRRFTDQLWEHLVPHPALRAARKPALAYEVFMILIHAADMANRDNLNWIVDMASLQEVMNDLVWREARQLAIDEKKEDLFDYSCKVLRQFDVYAPDPGAIKVPKRLFYKTMTKEGFIQWVCNGPRTVKNLMYIVERLYPYANIWKRYYHFVRNINYVFVSRRIRKRVGTLPYD